MTRTRTTLAALGIAFAFALVAAGCGSSGGSDAGSDGGSSGGTTTAASGSGDLPVALSGKVNNKGTKDISGDGDKADLSMKLDDNYYSPTFIKAAPGQTVTVELANEGSNPHTFTFDDGSTDQQVEPGEKATVEVTVPDSGSLRFSCDFHGSMGMQGAFFTGTGASSGGGTDGTTTTADSSSGGGSGY